MYFLRPPVVASPTMACAGDVRLRTAEEIDVDILDVKRNRTRQDNSSRYEIAGMERSLDILIQLDAHGEVVFGALPGED